MVVENRNLSIQNQLIHNIQKKYFVHIARQDKGFRVISDHNDASKKLKDKYNFFIVKRKMD